MSTEDLMQERKNQRALIEKIEQDLNITHRDYHGSHHTVLLVTLTVMTFIGGGFFHIYFGFIGAFGLAAYCYYLLRLGRTLEAKQKRLQEEEQRIMDIEKRINQDLDKNQTYA